MTDSRDDLIAKLTADNAALRAALKAAKGALMDCADSEDDFGMPSTKRWIEQRAHEAIPPITAVLATPNLGAGWVSPEEHAREMEAAWRAAKTAFAHIEAERDAARARLAEVEEQNREWKEDAAKVLAEKCAKDERHCVCVVHLRKCLAEVEAELEKWITLNRQNGEVGKRVVEGFQVELARVKAEAEGLRAACEMLVEAQRRADEGATGFAQYVEALDLAKAALASPTPAQGDE